MSGSLHERLENDTDSALDRRRPSHRFLPTDLAAAIRRSDRKTGAPAQVRHAGGRVPGIVVVFGAILLVAAAGCTVASNSASPPVGRRVLAGCFDRSLSMPHGSVRLSLSLWAREIRWQGRQHSAAPRIFLTGLIGGPSYARAFAQVAPISLPALSGRPTNPLDTTAIAQWEKQAAELRGRADAGAARIERLRPRRVWGTDVSGCLLRAQELGASAILLSSDLLQYGYNQRALLDLTGTDVAILHFCTRNDAAVCRARVHRYIARLRSAGVSAVRLLDPALVVETDHVF